MHVPWGSSDVVYAVVALAAAGRELLGRGRDRLHRRVDGALPLACDRPAPRPADGPEVGAELAHVRELGATAVDRAKLEVLLRVRDRPAEQAEVDAARAVEADGLDGHGRDRADARAVGRDDLIRPPLEHGHLLAQRP